MHLANIWVASVLYEGENFMDRLCFRLTPELLQRIDKKETSPKVNRDLVKKALQHTLCIGDSRREPDKYERRNYYSLKGLGPVRGPQQSANKMHRKTFSGPTQVFILFNVLIWYIVY
jgi:hypothetical protein